MRNTNIFVILDEETLEVLKNKHGIARKFRSGKKANEFAAERLEMWAILHLHFNHKFIQHKSNH